MKIKMKAVMVACCDMNEKERNDWRSKYKNIPLKIIFETFKDGTKAFIMPENSENPEEGMITSCGKIKINGGNWTLKTRNTTYVFVVKKGTVSD